MSSQNRLYSSLLERWTIGLEIQKLFSRRKMPMENWKYIFIFQENTIYFTTIWTHTHLTPVEIWTDCWGLIPNDGKQFSNTKVSVSNKLRSMISKRNGTIEVLRWVWFHNNKIQFQKSLWNASDCILRMELWIVNF